jgi:hypothetical protein
MITRNKGSFGNIFHDRSVTLWFLASVSAQTFIRKIAMKYIAIFLIKDHALRLQLLVENTTSL